MVDYEALYMTGNDIKDALFHVAYLVKEGSKELSRQLMKPVITYLDYAGIVGRSSKSKSEAASVAVGGVIEGLLYGSPLAFIFATPTTYTLSSGITKSGLAINPIPTLLLMTILGAVRGVHALYEFNKTKIKEEVTH